MLELLIKALLGYLCGSLVGGLVLGRPAAGTFAPKAAAIRAVPTLCVPAGRRSLPGC